MSHSLLSKTDLAKRWGRDVKTINKWLSNGTLKPFRGTDNFPLTYIEAIEHENIDMDTVGVFAQRALKRENERLEKENAMLKGTLLQVAVTANEVAAQLMKGQAV